MVLASSVDLWPQREAHRKESRTKGKSFNRGLINLANKENRACGICARHKWWSVKRGP